MPAKLIKVLLYPGGFYSEERGKELKNDCKQGSEANTRCSTTRRGTMRARSHWEYWGRVRGQGMVKQWCSRVGGTRL